MIVIVTDCDCDTLPSLVLFVSYAKPYEAILVVFALGFLSKATKYLFDPHLHPRRSVFDTLSKNLIQVLLLFPQDGCGSGGIGLHLQDGLGWGRYYRGIIC